MSRRQKGSLLLLAAAFIWGTTFVAQMTGMDSLGPFSYGMCRYALGTAAVLVLWGATQSKRQRARAEGNYRSGWRVGLGAGCIMFFGTSLQQAGMLWTTVGKASFLTCLYIVLVPLAGIFLHQRIRAENWAGAALAVIGMYFLCIQDGFTVGQGDALELLGSLFWTCHILFVGHFSRRADVIEMSAAQLFVSFALSAVMAAIFEEIAWADIRAAAFAVFYAGVMSSGVAFTLQIIGQRYAAPSEAAIIMSLEGVFGALAGAVILHETMTAAQVAGCALMLLGMIVTQRNPG